MTLDHTNKYYYSGEFQIFFNAGRMALPLFGFVLAYNLAQPISESTHKAIINKLLLVALISSPIFIMLGGLLYGWWPLNILFLLLLFTVIVYLNNNSFHFYLIVLLFIIGGFFVEFWWFGLTYCLCAWRFCKNQTLGNFILWIISTGLLFFTNLNHWALLSIPVIYIISNIPLYFPRIKYFFYVYYPLHLLTIFFLTFYKKYG